MSNKESVTVPKEEYEELLKLKEELPSIIEKAKLDRDKENLAKLTQMHKDNPEKHREQSKKRYHQKKEEINARRREAYRAKKEAAKANPSSD